MGVMAAGGIGVGLVALAGAATAGERIERYWTVAEVDADGGGRVTEVLDYDFGPAPAFLSNRHGILRWVPGAVPASVSVSSPDAPDDVQVEELLGGDTEIRIGDPDRTVSGQVRYRIDYDLPGIRRGDVVDWETFGHEWDVPIEEAEVHLVTPFELEEPACHVGPAGSTAECPVEVVAPGHVTARVTDIDANEGVSIEGRVGAPVATPAVPEPPADRPDRSGTGLLPPAATAAAAAAVAAVPTTVFVRRAGRERVTPGGAADAAYGGGSTVGAAGQASAPEIRVDAAELARMATIEFAPPDGLTPPQGGVVLREQVRDEHKVAWLIQAAIDGVVDLDDSTGKTVVRRVADAPAPPEQQRILATMFAKRSEIRLGTYDKDFARAWRQVGDALTGWRDSSGLWDRRADQRKVAVLVIGVLVGLVGAGLAFVAGRAAGLSGAPWLVLVALAGLMAGGGLAAALGSWELHVRTPLGSALWLRTESFRRFLAESEGYHAEEAARRGVLREYTAWAVALGEIDRWARAVAASSIPPDTPGVRYVHMAPVLVASTSSTATPPSSSGGGRGGGSFGGGSVGGGAGGGGGSSW